MNLKKFLKNVSLLFLFSVICLSWLTAFPPSSEATQPDTGLASVELRVSAVSGLAVEKIGLADSRLLTLSSPLPLFSFLLENKPVTSALSRPAGGETSIILTGGRIDDKKLEFKINEAIKGTLTGKLSSYPGLAISLRFENISKEKIKLENLVPLGEGQDRVYITAGLPDSWPHYLSRTLLYRPGKTPVGVLLPDNAWHLGFCDLEISPGLYLTGLARRTGRDRAEFSRWAATIEPGGSVSYDLYFDLHQAPSLPAGLASDLLTPPEPWFQGLKIMFRERYLYDLDKFDKTLFERSDLQWIRKTYLMLLQFAWDHTYYDWAEQKITFIRIYPPGINWPVK